MSSNLQKALITGQDGSYLTEFLLAKSYEVHGIIRRASRFNTEHVFFFPSKNLGGFGDGGMRRFPRRDSRR